MTMQNYKNMTDEIATKIALFRGKEIRKTLKNGEWWFSVVDVVFALTDSPDAGAYWRKLKQRFGEEGSEVVTFCHGLKFQLFPFWKQFKRKAPGGSASTMTNRGIDKRVNILLTVYR